MGLFNRNSKNKNEEVKTEDNFITWIPLTSLEQLKTIQELSKSETVLIFKHSTRCGISKMVIKQFENLFTSATKHLKVYYLDLLNYREISNEIAATFQITHQSPQLIAIKNEAVVEHASHHDITEIKLSRFL